MRESIAVRRGRARALNQSLKVNYPDARCALDFATPLELLVATVLSAQCTDVRVNVVTKELFKTYRRAEDYADADPGELEDAIRSINFYRTKAKSLRALGRALVDAHAGEVPRSLEHLIELAGVGRKTANVVMGNAFGLATGIVVDTHVARVAARLGLTRAPDPATIEVDLQKLIPEDEWIMFAHRLIFHGRAVCVARRPRCERCPVEGECPKRGVAPPSD